MGGHCANRILSVFWQTSKDKPKHMKWSFTKDTPEWSFMIPWFHLLCCGTGKDQMHLSLIISLADAMIVVDSEPKRKKGKN